MVYRGDCGAQIGTTLVGLFLIVLLLIAMVFGTLAGAHLRLA